MPEDKVTLLCSGYTAAGFVSICGAPYIKLCLESVMPPICQGRNYVEVAKK